MAVVFSHLKLRTMKRKNYYLIWCVLFIFLILPVQFGCEQEDELQPEQTAEKVECQEQVGDGNTIYYWNKDDGRLKSTAPTLLAEGDGWVLLNNNIDEPDYDEQTIHDDLHWACKEIAKKAVSRYWVKEKLLGDNLAGFVAKKIGVTGIITYLLKNLPIVGDADEVKQVYVRESDGYTKIRDAGSKYWVSRSYGWFETATLIHHGSEHYDYKLELFTSNPNQGIPVKLATAVLPYSNCGETSTTLIWDFDLIVPSTGSARYVCVYLWRKSAGSTDSYVHYKTNYIQRYDYGDSPNSFTDSRDGQIYRTVQIGTQTWMAENLNYNCSGSYCYNNDPANGEIYGRLYTWDAAKTAAPAGWHLPTDAEWQTLVGYLGGSSVAGGKMKETGTEHWYSPNIATNESGFTALPGGSRRGSEAFYNLGRYADFWSATENSSSYAWYRYLCYHRSDVYRYYYYKSRGFSVRCVKD